MNPEHEKAKHAYMCALARLHGVCISLLKAERDPEWMMATLAEFVGECDAASAAYQAASPLLGEAAQ